MFVIIIYISALLLNLLTLILRTHQSCIVGQQALGVRGGNERNTILPLQVSGPSE